MPQDKVAFTLGQIVYFRLKPESAGMVTGIIFRSSGTSYLVTWSDFEERSHFECEITSEKSYIDTPE